MIEDIPLNEENKLLFEEYKQIVLKEKELYKKLSKIPVKKRTDTCTYCDEKFTFTWYLVGSNPEKFLKTQNEYMDHLKTHPEYYICKDCNNKDCICLCDCMEIDCEECYG
jgi:hypothetical protein